MYEIIVVGGGHAGCEAAYASAKKGHKTLLITSNIKNIADMPCNPHIGGSAKGIVVREIDALGGIMGKIADKTHLQIKMLNSAKGPAVQSLRAQGDKITYPQEMLKELKSLPNLTIKEAMVEDLMIDKNVVTGIILEDKEEIKSKIVILTTGTYLKADILVGNTRTRQGPHGERPSLFLSDKLKEYGFEIKRLKTGTPQRIDRKTIDFSKLKEEPGDNKYLTFSFDLEPQYKIEDQLPCHLTYTTEETHKIIRDNLNKSSMYGALDDIEGIGPRYCPSIEDKIVRFRDKERHQLFIEPLGEKTSEMYIQGMSSSLPEEVQIQMYRTVPGLENAKLMRPAYAIEYDCIDSTNLKLSLEYKGIEGLFFAGQVNGSSGYEEAAAQGIMAGINASRKIDSKEPVILDRSEAYIGVLIDDLVTKGTNEPYRMMTSRAEYRLMLRQDNADERLTPIGYEVGLISEERYSKFKKKQELITKEIERLQSTSIKPSEEINNELLNLNSSKIQTGVKLSDLLKRSELNYNNLCSIDKERVALPDSITEEAEIKIKYEGYIKLQLEQINDFKKMENKKLNSDIDYENIKGLSLEARQKLNKQKPTSVGQASRISGVSPADISVLLIYLSQNKL